ncbi:DNA-processing protein DprA [Catenovulum sp. 2E275]|uniref:DNA-processing protein DprA n=1 Tax=Catenovulum sp. 2E275 TaxID=2980497 RepID=UPI0021D0D82F|nr:DNA-processing protein DprA [Catenovulum sp. 2E275]MCU4675879.1 DNA-processing protein DprA [Catenovulum sp. 2E275]
MSKGLQNLTEHWLAFKQVKGLRVSQILRLLEFSSLEKIYQSDKTSLAGLGFKPEQIQQIQNTDFEQLQLLLDWQASNPQHHIIHYQSELYPELLKQISSPPLILYAIGDITLLNQPQIALVGSRHASHYGQDNAFQFAKALARHNLVVTSGFAAGIDGHAHRGALDGDGKTIAVLGTGPDVIYPKRNQALYQQILEQGLMISEFMPGTQARAQHFPRRNRIISGLSYGVLVVEAALQSGSLITAKYALEQNREVFAIPGSIHDPRSKGCHQLIQQGAKLVQVIDDLIEELPQVAKTMNFSLFSQNIEKNTKENFTSHELLVNLDYEVTSIDELVERTQQPVDLVLSQLLDLELQGLIAATSGGYIRLRRE